jgi:hypothetical protein
MKITEIDQEKYKMRVNMARVADDGSRLWFVSFTTRVAPKYGYYQNYYREPRKYDILDTYNNFLGLLRIEGIL